MTEAHRTSDLAELVCSNSLKSQEPTNAHGLLKAEMELLDSLLLRIARETQIPGGKALVVDRTSFSRRVTEAIAALPNVTLRREESKAIPEEGIVIIATGPLTSSPLAEELARFLGSDSLYFYDAISPIVSADSIDRTRCFAANRYIPGDDYLNCPLSSEEYNHFYDALLNAEQHQPHEQASSHEQQAADGSRLTAHGCLPSAVGRQPSASFEGCLPIEDIAHRGKQALLFGPMKPVGLIDPASGRQPFAVVQLRRENHEGTMYNLVGFQTRMTQGEQRRVLGMIPALANAEFLRYGSVHRNTFINTPVCLKPTLQTQKRDTLFIAGQLTGVEGYVESIGAGLWAGINAARLAVSGQQSAISDQQSAVSRQQSAVSNQQSAISNEPSAVSRQPSAVSPLALLTPPPVTILGGLLKYITTPNKHFQPMNANFGLLPTPNVRRNDRPRAYANRSLAAMTELLKETTDIHR
jgi:methylenetetrahydrofolate--tRNA-(uracil-5-)-methyltransferase